MNVKERRIDLRWKRPVEADEICKTIIQERSRLMKEKIAVAQLRFSEILPNGFEKYKNVYPEVYARLLRSFDTCNAQALRWVYDECSPVEWDDSDAYKAVAELGNIVLELAALEVYR